MDRAEPKPARRCRSTLTPQLAERICERLENGESLRQICQDPIMPAKSTIFLWLRKDKEFAIQYRCAKQVQIDRMLCQFGEPLMEIADNSTNDIRSAKAPDRRRQAPYRQAHA